MRAIPQLLSVASCCALVLTTLAGQAGAQVVSASNRPPPAIQLRYEYVGYYGENHGEPANCPASRRDGTHVVEGSLKWARGTPPGNVHYNGKGRVTINVDECNLKLVNETNEYCSVSVVSSYDAELTFDVRGVNTDDNTAREVDVRWKPFGPVSATVSGDCEPKWVAELQKRVIAGVFQPNLHIVPGNTTDRVRTIANGGIPRAGVYTNPDPDPSNTGRWTLSLNAGPAQADVIVTIEGPACACLDGEKVPGANVKWSAKASHPGGTFGPFTVRTAGPVPKIVSNSGGAAGARLTLEPTQATEAVTLTATYTYKGRAITATRDVEFCVFDSVRIGDGSRSISFEDANPGNLRVQAKSRAFYNGSDVSAELAWKFEPIGTPPTTTMVPANPAGGVADVTYTGLPVSNADFGPKRIEVSLDKGSCVCRRTDRFRAFFSPTATNHPPPPLGIAQGTTPVPNWFYYYSQTPAIAGVPGVLYAPKVFSSRDNQAAIAQFNETDGNIYFSDLLWQGPCRPSVPKGGKPVAPSGAGNDGIDCVAETTRHEAQHRADWAAWWPNGYLILVDPDLDAVPISVEAARPGCSSVSRASCDERPFTDVGDREINAYWVGWRWQTGSINTQDWACGPKGKQWKAGYFCPDDP